MKRDRVLKARDELREHCKGNQYNCSSCIFRGGPNGCTLYGVPHTWRDRPRILVKSVKSTTWKEG